jgi:DEAD/DEAH box helicase domain-containing protein
MTTSGFGVLSGDTFTSGFGFGSTSTSGFGALGSGSVFGSALGNGFSGGSGPKLSSFAAPGKEVALASKPAKAFGAPESDEEDGGDDEGSDGCADLDEEKDTTDEKKKFKIAKGKTSEICSTDVRWFITSFTAAAHVEDGESGEATLLQLRAKLFALESKEAGWKERGVGTLKINVPKPCVSFDENGVAIPGSFDASGLEEEGEDESSSPRCPRLIMRQENTHRVILNTIIVRAMEFIDKPSTTAAQIMFTAFEGEKDLRPVNMLFKASLVILLLGKS